MADQLWQKGLPLDERIHRFTTGSDPQTDLVLAPFDVIGTAAHVRMLAHVGLLSQADAAAIVQELKTIADQIERGEFIIQQQQEDCHTAIEQALTAALGDVGKNVHLGRSRNDQVILALRLYMRQSVLSLLNQCAALIDTLLSQARENVQLRMPGYTHLRKAMPSSVALWLMAYAEGLLEQIHVADSLLARLDANPLGAGAGFGVPLPLDRKYVADLLAFSKVQRNPMDVQNSRGRHDLALANWISEVGNLLEKFFWDVALFSMEELGFVRLPDEFTTGSSIMPQKRNPDVVELGRARCRQLRGIRGEIEQLACGLPGSYHRDLQFLKEPTIRAVDTLSELIDVTAMLLQGMKLDVHVCERAMTPELYATHEAYHRALSGGTPFRDAYAEVGIEAAQGALQVHPEAMSVSSFDAEQSLIALESELASNRLHFSNLRQQLKATLESVLKDGQL